MTIDSAAKTKEVRIAAEDAELAERHSTKVSAEDGAGADE
jgi:hypothetical protein